MPLGNINFIKDLMHSSITSPGYLGLELNFLTSSDFSTFLYVCIPTKISQIQCQGHATDAEI